MLSAVLSPVLFSLSAAARPSGATSLSAGFPADTLPNVEVVAMGKSDVRLLPLNTVTVDEGTIVRSAEASLLPVLQSNVPGMFVSQRGLVGYGVSGGAAGTVNIRGVGQGNKVLFMIDGMPQFAGLFGHSLPDVYNANGVAKVEVVKGPSSLLYGSGAMGGSVNIITHRRLQDGWFGRARAMFGSYNTQCFSLGAGVKRGGLEVNLSGQLNRSDGNRPRSAFWDASELLQVKYEADAHWTVGALAELTQTNADNPGTIQAPLYEMTTYMFRGSSAVYAHDNYGVAHGGVQAFLSWGSHRVNDGYNPLAGETPQTFLFHSTDYDAGFNLFQTMHFWQGNALSAGVDFQHWGGHSWTTVISDGSVRELTKKSENEVGVYLMMQQSFFGDILDLNAGVRYQHGSSYGSEWVPQAGFILHPYSGGSLKFSFSKGFRAPNIRELYMYAPANPDLKPERMLNYEVELRQRLLDDKLSVGLSLFFIDADNMIQVRRVDGRPRNMNIGRFINKGIEFDGSYAINSDWGLGASYAYLHSSDHALLYAPKNMVNAHLDYHPGNLEVTLESQNVWGLKNGAPDNVSTNYSLLNLRAAYTFRSKCDIRPFVKLDNITDTHYEVMYGCPMAGISILGGVELNF